VFSTSPPPSIIRSLLLCLTDFVCWDWPHVPCFDLHTRLSLGRPPLSLDSCLTPRSHHHI
jgi:hypothetical protein